MAFTNDSINLIVNFANSNSYRINAAKDKLNIYEGGLLPYIKVALQNELSANAYERAVKRIAPINMLPKVINKLSTLYNNTVIRTLREESDNNKEIMDHYIEILNVDEKGRNSNSQLNLNKYTAWEIYISEDGMNEPNLRVLPANQFLVYSDNREDPTKETVFIKILGTYNKDTGLYDDATNEPIIREVILYKLYDKDQILVVDSEGEIRNELMEGNPDGINPYGIIPFVYIRNSKYSLLPMEETSDIPMTVLIPILLTDLNYATQFMSHSIIYAIDADISNLSGNPDSIWHIKSDETDIADGGSKTAKIGTIKPEVDIDKVLQLIQAQLALWLDSKEIKAQGIGSIEASNLASGISKMIDEADTTKAIKTQIEIYREAEKQLWIKLGIMHNIWVDQGFFSGTDINKRVDGDLRVNTVFEEPQVVVDEEARIRTIKAKEDAGYTSHEAAVREANPELGDDEINTLMLQIKQERQEINTITIMENEDGSDTEENEEQETSEEDGTTTPEGGVES